MPNFMRPIHFSLLFTLTPLMFAIGGCGAKPPTNTTITTLTNPHRIVYPDISRDTAFSVAKSLCFTVGKRQVKSAIRHG